MRCGARAQGIVRRGWPPPSYAHGAVDTPLLGETIGANLDRTIARFPDGEALVVAPPGRPLD